MSSRVRLESSVERPVCEHATARQITFLKLNVRYRRGWPDVMFLFDNAVVVFVEFKRPGEKQRKLQVYIGGVLMRLGFPVYVVDNVEAGIRLLERYRADQETAA